MLVRGVDGRFVREDRKESLNINIGIFTILKYLIVLAAIFQWYKLIEKTEILPLVQTVNVQPMNTQSMNVLHAFV